MGAPFGSVQLLAYLERQNSTQRGTGEGPETMAKLNHQKRNRPRPASSRRRRANRQRAEEQRSRRNLERWRRSQ